MFEGNTVVCPNCETHFEYNKINGMALIQAAENIKKQKRMYCRLTLDALENLHKNGGLTFSASKKTILDNFNDFSRSVLTIVGFGTDSE